MTLARLEAQKEQSDLIRSWSKEDVSSNQFVSFNILEIYKLYFQEEVSNHPIGPSASFSAGFSHKTRESPKRGGLALKNKSKPMSPDEWLRKLEAESHQDEDDENLVNGFERLQSGQSKRGKKKKKSVEDPIQQGNFFLSIIFNF